MIKHRMLGHRNEVIAPDASGMEVETPKFGAALALVNKRRLGLGWALWERPPTPRTLTHLGCAARELLGKTLSTERLTNGLTRRGIHTPRLTTMEPEGKRLTGPRPPRHRAFE